jgi:hypothetical protein
MALHFDSISRFRCECIQPVAVIVFFIHSRELLFSLKFENIALSPRKGRSDLVVVNRGKSGFESSATKNLDAY